VPIMSSNATARPQIASDELREIVMKLLDRAGKDPRLTARLLREKAEEKLKLKRDSLKDRRSEIKDMIEAWWRKNVVKEDADEELTILKRLVKYAKAVGKGPTFFKGIAEVDSYVEKAGIIRKR
jgi:hypothetical protein